MASCFKPNTVATENVFRMDVFARWIKRQASHLVPTIIASRIEFEAWPVAQGVGLAYDREPRTLSQELICERKQVH
jgi:hypothetical protein